MPSAPATTLAMLREGLIFGTVGGLVGGAAIYLYFAVVNPAFSVGGHATDAGSQALAGFAGALALGTLLMRVMAALRRRRGRKDG